MLFATLADLRQSLGDEEAEARVVARAIREGASSPSIDAHLERLADHPATPDAQLWRMEARAAHLSASDPGDAAAWAWRDLGAALWDLADDRRRALEAWQFAARTATTHGYTTLALDLVAFAGAEFAFGYLGRWIEGEEDDAIAGTIAVDAAQAGLSIGDLRFAFDFASRALARSPARADALEIAERAASGAPEQVALSGLYGLMGRARWGDSAGALRTTGERVSSSDTASTVWR